MVACSVVEIYLLSPTPRPPTVDLNNLLVQIFELSSWTYIPFFSFVEEEKIIKENLIRGWRLRLEREGLRWLEWGGIFYFYLFYLMVWHLSVRSEYLTWNSNVSTRPSSFVYVRPPRRPDRSLTLGSSRSRFTCNVLNINRIVKDLKMIEIRRLGINPKNFPLNPVHFFNSKNILSKIDL